VSVVGQDSYPRLSFFIISKARILRSLTLRNVVEAVIRHTDSIDVAVQTLLGGIHEQTWLDKDKVCVARKHLFYYHLMFIYLCICFPFSLMLAITFSFSGQI
jgi:hypothetical protein